LTSHAGHTHHADGRSVDHQIGLRHLRRIDGGHRPAGRSGQCGHGTGAVRCSVDHGHVGGAGSAQGMGHGPGRAAGPDHQAALARRFEAGGSPERSQKAVAVRVGTVQRPALIDDAIDRLQLGRHL
jgi:hypothetical protein